MEGSESMMSQSPASVQVRWHYDNMVMMQRGKDWGSESASGAYLSEAWRTPDAAEMKRRLLFRQSIREETLQHRRIHRHGGIVGGRNIAHVLEDRRIFGSRAMRHNANYKKHTQERNTSVFSKPPQASRKTVPHPGSLTNEIRTFGEYSSVVRYHSAFCKHLGGDDQRGTNGQRPSSSQAVSTISIAFSPDSQTMASTHGDHTVKITSCGSGRLLQNLEGHPRTPWTVKYHPLEPSILASGCLGHQVRVWNWESAACLHMIRLEFAIISLSFHPTGKVLAIANGTRLHFWALDGRLKISKDDDNTDVEEEIARPPQRRGLLTEVEQRHMLRCVHFPPNGDKVIVGGVNPTTEAHRPRRGGISGGGMSFYLRLWDFDLEAALRPGETNMGLRRRAISNPRIFVPRALLYNDGGFDVSPDGKTLCACAEYWLPDGVENAMDLLYPAGEGESCESDDNSGGESSMTASFGVARQSDDPEESSVEESPRNQTSTRQQTQVSPPRQRPGVVSQTPNATLTARGNPATPQTPPPNAMPGSLTLSPPSPPGRRFAGGLGRPPATSTGLQSAPGAHSALPSASIPPPPPPAGHRGRPPNPFSVLNKNFESGSPNGRYVPHVVTISLDTSPVQQDLSRNRSAHPLGDGSNSIPVSSRMRPRLGQLLEACPLDGTKASAVTCVKFSPSTDFCLIGYGVREPVVEHNGNHYHPVAALYRVRGGMTHVSTMLSGDDDVNIARFHPDPGYGFVYGTKQGRVRVLSPRPWNFYNC